MNVVRAVPPSLGVGLMARRSSRFRGSTRPETIVDAMAAIDLCLGTEQLQLLDTTVGEGTSQYPDDLPDPPPLRSMHRSPIGRFAADSRRVVVMADVTIYHNQH